MPPGVHAIEVRSGRFPPLRLEVELQPAEELQLRHVFAAPPAPPRRTPSAPRGGSAAADRAAQGPHPEAAVSAARPPAALPFTHLGRYSVVRELGRGAMGVVYLAEDESLLRQVAIKTLLLPDEAGERGQLEARFLQEAKAAGSLNHPGIITIHDLGREGDWLYIAMELLEGSELRDRMADGMLPLHEAWTSRRRWRRRWGRPTRAASCTATSSPATSCCWPTATRRSWTSASRACRSPTCAPRAAP